MNVYPTRMERRPGQRLFIAWSDGEQREYTYRELQDNCPCATCREKRKAPPANSPATSLLPVLAPGEAQPLEINRMEPVGNYAYHIFFNHGCDSGIYSLELLRQLGRPVTAVGNAE